MTDIQIIPFLLPIGKIYTILFNRIHILLPNGNKYFNDICCKEEPYCMDSFDLSCFLKKDMMLRFFTEHH